jgi:RNA polymerase sigma factor (sigma-70 family)
MKHLSNEEILDAVLTNNKEVLYFLYEHNFESLFQLIRSEGGTRKDAEDVFHDALLVLYLKIRNNSLILTCSVHTFLQSIARNIWKRLRKQKALNFVEIDGSKRELSDEPGYDEELVKVERRKLYLHHLEDMPEDCKKLIKLVTEGLDLHEITKLMTYNSVEFTKTKRSRCKILLIKKIINDPLFKELKNERFRATDSLPRW